MMLDRALLESGIFERPFHVRLLKKICDLALQTDDSTAAVVDGSESVLQEALEENVESDTLLCHDFEPFSCDKNVLPKNNCLRQLCLSNCAVDNLDGCSNVEVLVLWKCTFDDLKALSNLKALVIVESFVQPAVLEVIFQESPLLERIALIRAGNIPNPRKRMGYYLSPSAKSLSMNSSVVLKEIVLQGTLLPFIDMVRALNPKESLAKLSLSNTWLPEPLAMWMARALAKTSTLRALQLREVQWTPKSLHLLVNGLRLNRSIRCLNLSSTLWYAYPQVALYELLEGSTSLTEVIFEAMVDPSALGGILEACSRSTTIKTLSLGQNSLDEASLLGLTTLLKGSQLLERIDLTNCHASDMEGWTTPLLSISNNRSLKSISLEHCNVGNIGAVAIGKALTSNIVIESIDLCHNSIGMLGCQALTEGLKHNQSLKRLYLHKNKIEHQGGDTLLRDLICNGNLTLEVIFLPESSLQEEMQYYGMLNYTGRRFVRNEKLPHSLWPRILERASERADMMIFLLQQKPDLFRRQKAGKKRCIDEVTQL